MGRVWSNGLKCGLETGTVSLIRDRRGCGSSVQLQKPVTLDPFDFQALTSEPSSSLCTMADAVGAPVGITAITVYQARLAAVMIQHLAPLRIQ